MFILRTICLDTIVSIRIAQNAWGVMCTSGAGEPIDKALMVLVPEAYQNHPDLDANYPAVKDFYRYYEGLQARSAQSAVRVILVTLACFGIGAKHTTACCCSARQ